MKRFFLQLLVPLFAAAGFCAAHGFGAAPAANVPKPNVLPLALDDAFQFRKTSILRSDDKIQKPSNSEMINFERVRLNYGVITNYDRFQRSGYYYTFYWRAKRAADITIRLEYRQQNLGSYVQAQERSYKAAKGTTESKFSILGDEYNDQGRVTAWRALLIENGRIVALNQSFLWD
jgi:hypothetical protein